MDNEIKVWLYEFLNAIMEINSFLVGERKQLEDEKPGTIIQNRNPRYLWLYCYRLCNQVQNNFFNSCNQSARQAGSCRKPFVDSVLRKKKLPGKVHLS